MYPSAIHVLSNGTSLFPAGPVPVSKMLADNGYYCGLIGKLHLADSSIGPEPRTDDGFQFFEYSNGPKLNPHWKDDYVLWLENEGEDPVEVLGEPSEVKEYKREMFASFVGSINRGGLKIPTVEADNVSPELHQTTWCAEKAIGFILDASADEEPWFLSVNPFDPHAPFDPPWEYFRRYDPEGLPGPSFHESDLPSQELLAAIDFQSRPRRPEEINAHNIQAAYYAMIELIDEQFGRILSALDNSGQLENTVVIFSSDHGEALGDHGLLLKGCRFYEGLVRVPLICSWAGHFEKGLRSDALIELIDIVPTLLEITNTGAPERIQGRSFLPILTGQSCPGYHREFVRGEYYDALPLPDGTLATMYRDQRWKLVVYHGHQTGELFDLRDDPNEFENLWADSSSREIRENLLLKSFDASILAMDWGPPLVPKYENRPAFDRTLGEWH